MAATAEVAAHGGDVGHAECALGGAAQVRREAAVAFQEGVVDERLQEDGAAAGTQDARDSF